MFRLVALITYATRLINDHKSSWNKPTNYGLFTLTFIPKQRSQKFLKTTTPPGLYPSDSPLHGASAPPIPRAPPCRVKPPQLHLKIVHCLDGVNHSSLSTLQPPAKGAKRWGRLVDLAPNRYPALKHNRAGEPPSWYT